MELTLRQIKSMEPALIKICAIELPLGLSLKMTRNVKMLRVEVDLFNTKHLEIAEKYSQCQTNDGDNINANIPDEFAKDFEDDLRELLNFKVDVQISKININEIASFDKDSCIRISPAELYSLDCILE